MGWAPPPRQRGALASLEALFTFPAAANRSGHRTAAHHGGAPSAELVPQQRPSWHFLCVRRLERRRCLRDQNLAYSRPRAVADRARQKLPREGSSAAAAAQELHAEHANVPLHKVPAGILAALTIVLATASSCGGCGLVVVRHLLLAR